MYGIRFIKDGGDAALFVEGGERERNSFEVFNGNTCLVDSLIDVATKLRQESWRSEVLKSKPWINECSIWLKSEKIHTMDELFGVTIVYGDPANVVGAIDMA